MQEYLKASSICLTKGTTPSHVNVNLPASKSISNRLLILRYLSKKKLNIRNLSLANDSILLQDILFKNEGEINVQDAGTTARFSLAWACTKNTSRKISGSQRLSERPMSELITALRQLGFNIKCLEKEGFFPVNISPINFSELQNKVTIIASRSSQFISALCLIAPFLPQGLFITLEGEASSKPYIEMTLSLLKELGVSCFWNGNTIEINPNVNLAGNIEVEADWSAAAFWYEVVSVNADITVFLSGLKKESIQGDREVVELFSKVSVNSVFKNNGVEIWNNNQQICLTKVNFSNTPDLAQAFIVTCALKSIPIIITGIQTLKNKETDRIKALQNELEHLGTKLIEQGNEYHLRCGIAPIKEEFNFKSYSDHRMAMALAPVIFLSKKVVINDPKVVTKSYPSFWDELEKFGILKS